MRDKNDAQVKFLFCIPKKIMVYYLFSSTLLYNFFYPHQKNNNNNNKKVGVDSKGRI